MIVDSSALVAIVRNEPGSEQLRRKIVLAARPPKMASATFLETTIVIDGRSDPTVRRKLDDLIEKLEIEIVPFTAEHARIAREAYRDFGKGSGHPAKLNFGDAMAYAVAWSEHEPLLYVGNDFTHTGIAAA